MGTQVSVDKHVTSIEDLIALSTNQYVKVKPEFEKLEQTEPIHLRIWRFYEDSTEAIKTQALNLNTFEFRFKASECYIILAVSRGPLEEIQTDISDSLDWYLHMSSTNYLLYTANGKRSPQIVRAQCLTIANELESLLIRAKDAAVQVLFAGGVIRNKKLQKTSVLSIELPFPIRPISKEKFGLIKESHLNASAPYASLFRTIEALSPVKPAGPNKLNFAGLKNRAQELDEFEAKLENIENLDDNVNIRDTNRKLVKMAYYSEICSEMYKNIYVGGVDIAKNISKLREAGITHIINCAGDVCRNYYPEQFTYQTYFLKDGRSENIECVFYDSIEFIDNAFQSGGKVFIHCMQGVSRSITICLAYIMFKDKKPFEVVYNESKSKRGISSPNIGFQVQLMQWYKRLFEPEAMVGRVFAVSSHQVEQPHRVISRKLDKLSLDRRGVFLVYNSAKTFIWRGSQVHPANLERYMQIAQVTAKRLAKFEHWSEVVEVVEEGAEPPDFWDSGRANSDINPDWDNWYLQLDKVQDSEPKSYREEAVEDEKPAEDTAAKLYVYPELRGSKIFDEDDLMDENLMCLCVDKRCFVWKGVEF